MIKPSSTLDPAAIWSMGYTHLEELRSSHGFNASDAAGQYSTLFGRDSLWILTLMLEAVRRSHMGDFKATTEKAGATILSSLAELQGSEVDDDVDEQPGKIIHEFRPALDQRLTKYRMPFKVGRTYCGFDETFLFVTTLRKYLDCFPSSPLVQDIWLPLKRAVEWIEVFADHDNDGFYEYLRRGPANPIHQVWKDSFDSVTHTGFEIPPQPLAWIEVQGYAYRALRDAAALFARFDADGGNKAERLSHKAGHLKDKLDDFWLEQEECYAVALDADKRQIEMVTSNNGHLLWAGVLDLNRAKQVVERLMEPDMMTPYGLRTLSSKDPYYAPFAYHRGSIWPFDNAIFAMGLLSYGFDQEALRVIEGVAGAVLRIETTIELYLALDTQGFVEPILAPREALALRHFPPENRNQGWTAASLLFFATALAGLHGEEFTGGRR